MAKKRYVNITSRPVSIDTGHFESITIKSGKSAFIDTAIAGLMSDILKLKEDVEKAEEVKIKKKRGRKSKKQKEAEAAVAAKATEETKVVEEDSKKETVEDNVITN